MLPAKTAAVHRNTSLYKSDTVGALLEGDLLTDDFLLNLKFKFVILLFVCVQYCAVIIWFMLKSTQMKGKFVKTALLFIGSEVSITGSCL